MLHDPAKLLAFVLRVVGAVECLAFGAILLPFSWMAATHAWLGLGAMSDAPILLYLIRQVSFVYGSHGILLLIMASNVERFRSLIIFTGFSYLVSGPILAATGANSRMPWFWFMAEGLSCLSVGIVLLCLTKLTKPTPSAQS